MHSYQEPESLNLDERDATVPKMDKSFLRQSATDKTNGQPSEVIVCPSCRQQLRAGELVCSHCQMVLLMYGKTEQLEKHVEMKAAKDWPTGELLAPESKSVRFEIFDEILIVSINDSLILGRASSIAGDEMPAVDLTPFGAGEFGVSRLHLRIKRRGALLYVADLGTTNGTLLNGRPLFAHTERLLRDGDELFLSHLRMKVHFT
jgi:hypothetical protein